MRSSETKADSQTGDHNSGDGELEDGTSGATSGEEVWGTPTSGGAEMDDMHHGGFLNSEGHSVST